MQSVAYLGCTCTATISPYGPCVGLGFGQIITGSDTVFVSGIPTAMLGSQIAYSALIYPYTGGSPIYVSWIGHVLNSDSTTLADGLQLATVGTPTDANGFVIEGDPNIYA